MSAMMMKKIYLRIKIELGRKYRTLVKVETRRMKGMWRT